MSTRYIGPVALSDLFDPAYSWRSASDPRGFREASIGGLLEWEEANQLAELVANPALRQTIGGVTGALVDIYADDDLLRPFNGGYLLIGMEQNPDYVDSFERLMPFSLDAVYLGDNLQWVLARTSRARDNDFDLSPKAIAVDPFLAIDDVDFIVASGASLTREYDANPHAGFTADVDAQLMPIRVESVESVQTVVLPARTVT